jgi:hypothetical protein
MEKTYKRETASVVLAVWGLMWAAGALHAGAAEQAEAIKAYVFTFAGLAFGMDSYSKQIK